MTTWRHTQHDDAIPGCDVEVRRDIDPATWWLEPCGCQSPTPDPASPCAACDGRGPHVNPGVETWSNQRHPHIPTRCTCGHQLEAVNAR